MVIRRWYEQFVRLVEAAQFVQSQRSQRPAMRARKSSLTTKGKSSDFATGAPDDDPTLIERISFQ